MEQNSQLIDVELKKLDSGKIVLRAGWSSGESKGKIDIYYAQDGWVTPELDKAFEFNSNVEAATCVNYFRAAIEASDNSDNPEVRERFESIKFVLMLVSDQPGIPDEYYFKEQSLTTSILDNATKFDTPTEAASNKAAYRMVLGGEGPLLGRMTVKPVSEIIKGSLNEAAALIGVPSSPVAVSKEPSYILRFVNPDAMNDIEGDITAPCWFRYYCEGDLVQSMEAAEWFDNANAAMQVCKLLQNARAEDQSLTEMDPALSVKLRVLGILGESPSINGVQITFRHGVLIQVLQVKETETGGYDWNTFYQDGFQWVFEDPSTEEDGPPAEDDEEEHTA